MIHAEPGVPLALLSPAEVWDRVDPLCPDLGADPADAMAALPYGRLLGPGFERLCYELLLAEGHSPRFFGHSGQKDYGVDIVVESGETRTLYQCKNLREAPRWTAIRGAVAKFESDWLSEAGLPRPDRFVYCCPHPLNDKDLATQWTEFRDDFHKRTGVELAFLDRHALDTRLRLLPDLVAGLFSGSHAEQFCGRDGWLDDPWTRVQWGKARYASIDRFLERHGRGAIHVSQADNERFLEAMSRSSVLAFRGVPGSGKTLTGLELACRLRTPLRRIYYATLKDMADDERLWRSLRRRTGLPAVFVLDDCHLALERVATILERLNPELGDPRGTVKVVLLLRDLTGAPARGLDDTPEWLRWLERNEVVIDMSTDPARTRAVTEHLRPELVGLSKERLERLHDSSGGDLILLEELLSSVVSAQDIDDLRPEHLYEQLRLRYFGGNRRLPTIRMLACVAQFDLTPAAGFVDGQWQPGEKALTAPLVRELFAPPRYQLLHSSLAELVLRGLLTLEVGADRVEGSVVDVTAKALCDYYHHVIHSAGDGAAGSQPDFVRGLEILLRARLKLTDLSDQAKIASLLLADTDVRNAIEARLDQCTFSTLLACLTNLSAAGHPAKETYVDLVLKRFRLLGKLAADRVGLATAGAGFLALARHAPATLEVVENEFGASGFLRLTLANGTMVELFKILEYASPGLRRDLLKLLSDETVGTLVDKTVAAGRSIGTINFAMRELGGADPAMLASLEQAIGAGRFLRLIVANGTLFELFKILENATPGLRRDLLKLLSDETVETLVDKTIAAGRSIGTINFAMRELGGADPAMLASLEQAIGAGRFLRLIVANGTLFELFKILENATPAFRYELFGLLNNASAETLVDKTIAAGRSIGTLDMTMRRLGHDDATMLDRLEKAIGVGGFLRLIIGNGTLFELFRILERATPGFRHELLKLLNDVTTGMLVDKTIAAGRSIRTLHLSMRELGDADAAVLDALERAIGAQRFVRLVVANGTLLELFKIVAYATPGFRQQLLGLLDETTVGTLVDKAIAAGRSIGTLHLYMRELGDVNAAMLSRLEKAIGAEGFLRLISANGTLFELFRILDYATPGFRGELLGFLNDATTGALVDKAIVAGRSLESLHHTLRRLARVPTQREQLQQRLGIDGWWRLILGLGTLYSLARVSDAMSDSFRRGFIGASTKVGLADWREIIGRGKFWNACEFVADRLIAYPTSSQEWFREALASKAASLVLSAGWPDLNFWSMPEKPESEEGRILRDALTPRVDRIELTDLKGLELSDAANALAFCWRERRDLRPVLSGIWTFLPDPNTWSTDESGLGDLRFVLQLARTAAVHTEDALRLAGAVGFLIDQGDCAKLNTWTLFMLVWNLATVRYERGQGRSFESALSEVEVGSLLTLLQERVRPKGANDQKVALLALGGLIRFLSPRLGRVVRRVLAPLDPAAQWLHSEAQSRTFVPALFALEGLILLGGHKPVFTPMVCAGLLMKSKQYEDAGPSIEHLRERVRAYAKLR